MSDRILFYIDSVDLYLALCHIVKPWDKLHQRALRAARAAYYAHCFALFHAEAYAAGELKHGPLALIDADMPVIVVAPNNELLEKLKSNIEEVRARGGELYVFADGEAGFNGSDNMHIIEMPHVEETIAPIFYTVPLQLLAYHVALIKGTDVDQPRNLAKSVTVE